MPTNVTAARRYRMKCLGPVVLEGPSGARLGLRTRKQLGLLFHLARRAKPVARDELIELFWGEDDGRLARHSLSQCTSLINKMLGAEVIVTAGRDRLALADNAVATDVAEFERLVGEGRHDEALALWRGPLFEGIWVQRAPGFERWLSEEREKVQRLFRRLVHARIDALRNRGDHQEIRDEAERLLQHDPLDETAMHAYLEALTLLGDRSLALRRYAEFEARLRKELEAEPGAALKGWVKRQRKGDAAPSRDTGPIPRISEITVLPAAQPFYGRTEEFSMLWKAWEAAGTGRGSFIIIQGEAGIGKTALVTKLANQAHVAGGSVCFVRCYRAEKSVPFAPVTTLVRQLSRLPGFVALDPVWIGELTRLVPELKERFPAVPQPMAPDDAARHRLSDASVSAVLSVADEQDLMIVVDDLQNADEASLALLHYLGRQTPMQRVLLVGIVRDDGCLSEFEKTFLSTAEGAGFARILAVRALSPEAIGRLIEQILAHKGIEAGELTASIAATSAGNPLAAIEATLNAEQGRVVLSRVMAEDAGGRSPSFTETAGGRFATLSSEARSVATSIAFAGRPLSEYELSCVTGLRAAELAASVAVLESAGFVRRIGASIGFVHEEYSAAVDAGAGTHQRKELHSQLALLSTRLADANPALHFEAARHSLGAGDTSKAMRHARAAARYAGSMGAVRSKAEALELARSVRSSLTRNEFYELSECYLHLNDLEHLRLLCDSADTCSPTTRIECEYYKIASDYQIGSSFESIQTRLTALLEELSQSARCWPEAQVLLLRIADKTGSYSVVRSVARRLRKSRAPAHALFAAAYVGLKYFWAAKALPLMERSLEAAREHGHLELEQLARDGVAILLKQTGRYRSSIEQFNVSLALARKTMNPHAEVACLHNRAVSEMALGDWDQVRATHAEAEKTGSTFAQWGFHLFRRYNNGIVNLYESNLEHALEEFRITHQQCLLAGYHDLAREAKAGEALVFERLGDMTAMHAATEEVRSRGEHSRIALTWIDTAALAFDDALIRSRPDHAIRSLDLRIRELARRDVSHQLALELERLRLLESLKGAVIPEERQKLQDKATHYEAGAILQWIKREQAAQR